MTNTKKQKILKITAILLAVLTILTAGIIGICYSVKNNAPTDSTAELQGEPDFEYSEPKVYNMPKAMQKYFGKVVKKCSDSMGKELSPQEIFGLFEKWYINIETPYKLTKYKISSADSDSFDVGSEGVATNMLELEATINFNNHDYVIKGTGNGPVDAFSNALMEQDEEELKPLKNYKFVHYHEHALGEGSNVKGVAYIQIDAGSAEPYFGVGISENINTAAISALMHAIIKSYIKMNVE